ncbi:Na+/H+ antiporter subunit C [Pseudoalteromonas sp. NBT06-2]|uniref:cation:proton antiporter subunit C n=1 Tax=Pseudoalteromonas sp. NBT06-2 TaxID=2025950 RepID=UPI000BA69D53|nr:cation:proton antiporter subunit C [Pseudoalteromonas sp. NBT06-2]PAJ73039.1 Na+/H+ antiporter subunit C [Pseudoalteromonas sp. NBT06-2]
MNILESFNYWVVMILMMSGLYILIAHGNLVKKIIGLTIFQTSVYIFYISMANISGATAPIIYKNIEGDNILYSNPLPHVLILTAIVVGISTMALALALVIRIKQSYGTIEEDEIHAKEQQQ